MTERNLYNCNFCQTYKPFSEFRVRLSGPRAGKRVGAKCISCEKKANAKELLDWKKSKGSDWHANCPDRLDHGHSKECANA